MSTAPHPDTGRRARRVFYVVAAVYVVWLALLAAMAVLTSPRW